MIRSTVRTICGTIAVFFLAYSLAFAATVNVLGPEGAITTKSQSDDTILSVSNALVDLPIDDGTATKFDAGKIAILSNPNAVPVGSSILGAAPDGRSAQQRDAAKPVPPTLLIFASGLFGLVLLLRYRHRRQFQLGFGA